MTYRADERARCITCGQALVTSESVYSPSGELWCRRCSNTALVARTSAAVAEETYDRGTAGARAGAGRPWLVPGAIFTLLCGLQLAEHWASGAGCSEMSCIGLVLLPWIGMLVTAPTAFIGTLLAPPRDRHKVLLAGLAMMGIMLGTCVAPL